MHFIQSFKEDLNIVLVGSMLYRKFGKILLYRRTLILQDFFDSFVVFCNSSSDMSSILSSFTSYIHLKSFSGFVLHRTLKKTLNKASTAICGIVSQFNSLNPSVLDHSFHDLFKTYLQLYIAYFQVYS